MRKAKIFTVLAVLAFAASCDDGPTGPTISEVAGTYTATTYEITDDGGTTDLIAAGITIEISLDADGTTSGNMFLPDQFTEPEDPALNLSLDGTWTLSGNTVRFDHASDTFLRDNPFTADGVRLVMDVSEDGISGLLILTRSS